MSKERGQSRAFYYASSYHLPGIPGGGAEVARRAIPRIEKLTGDRSTAKWPFDFAHGEPWYAKQAALADVQSIKDADYLLFLPLTKTSRGTHTEAGMAMGLGKPVHGWRFHPEDDGTAFDALMVEADPRITAIIEEELAAVKAEHPGTRGPPPAMPKVGAA